jgi:L-amino acid N-acyltransferase YncA
MENVIIRAATVGDLESLLDIYNDVVLNTTATFEETPRTLSEFTFTYQDKMKLGLPWIVAEADKQIIGYGTYGSFRKASGYKTTVEHSLHVHPDFRGQGIGSNILGKLITLAKDQSLNVMIAGIDATNTTSIVLHEKFGFKKVGEIPLVARKFSKWLDLILMQLILNE